MTEIVDRHSHCKRRRSLYPYGTKRGLRSLNVGEEAADLAIEAFGLNRQRIRQ